MLLYTVIKTFTCISGLKEVIEEFQAVLPPKKQQTWAKRAEKVETNWEQLRPSLVKFSILREATLQVCKHCKKRQACIKCFFCIPQDLCEVCDLTLHKDSIYHDRKWFNNNSFQPLMPVEGIENGQVVSIGKSV